MFDNFKVIAHLGSPIATMDNIILDSIISCAIVKERLKDEYYNGSNVCGTKEEIDNWLGEFLDKKYGVYCTSIGFGDFKENVTTWSKRFDNHNDDLISFSLKGKERLDIGAGYFKNYHTPLIIKSYKTITFFVRGDFTAIKQLLEDNINFLGKKGSQGFGEVLRWEFKKINTDMSVFYKNTPMRPIPFEELENILGIDEFGFNIQEHSVIPPYWREDHRKVCVIP